MENYNFQELLSKFHLIDNLDLSTKEKQLKFVQEVMEFTYSKGFKELITNQNEKLSKYENNELISKLKDKIKPDFINDFIELKKINNNMTEEEINNIIKDNPRYQNEIKTNSKTIENEVLKQVIKNDIKDEKGNLKEFNIDDPLGYGL